MPEGRHETARPRPSGYRSHKNKAGSPHSGNRHFGKFLTVMRFISCGQKIGGNREEVTNQDTPVYGVQTCAEKQQRPQISSAEQPDRLCDLIVEVRKDTVGAEDEIGPTSG